LSTSTKQGTILAHAAALLSQASTLPRRQTRIVEQMNVFQPVEPQAFERISWN